MNTIEALQREAERHRLIVKKIESLIRDLQEISQPELGLPAEIKPFNGSPRPLTEMKQSDAVEEVLRRAGQATVREIYDGLRAGGLSLPKAAYVSTILSRDKKRFEHIGKGKWRVIIPERAEAQVERE